MEWNAEAIQQWAMGWLLLVAATIRQPMLVGSNLMVDPSFTSHPPRFSLVSHTFVSFHFLFSTPLIFSLLCFGASSPFPFHTFQCAFKLTPASAYSECHKYYFMFVWLVIPESVFFLIFFFPLFLSLLPTQDRWAAWSHQFHHCNI